MSRFEAGYLAFEFGNRWHVLKLDEHPVYRERIEKAEGTKAVDFLGILENRELYFIEVKDFRQFRIENKERLSSGELAIELAQKVRDSLACIIGAYRISSEIEQWQPYTALLWDRSKVVKVVLWLEHDLPPYLPARRKALASVRTNVFKQKLTWLTRRVLVCGSEQANLPDLLVSNLPRS